MIDSDRLLAFIAFAESRSFTEAARRLAISQPSLHVKIRKLADSLGVPLYRRQGRGLVLTRDGERLLAFAREMFERSERFESELKESPDRHPIVLAAGEGAFLYLLGDAIRRFVRESRNPPLRLLSRDHEGTLESVRLGEAHIGVAALEDLPTDLWVEDLVEVGAVIVVPSDHRLAKRRAIQLRDLEGESLIVPPPGRPHRIALSRALRAEGIEWESAVETGGWELMLHFVRLGVGVAIVNDCCRIPRGLTAKPLRELPTVVYYTIQREQDAASRHVETLKAGFRRSKSAR
ncbi:MAG: LysR family transcriptional regulator [Planctomycetota bacterium]